MGYNMKECGMRIRQLRTKSGFTQDQTAEALNIDRSFYSRIETGKSGCSLELAVQLSELFNVSLDYLVLGKHSRALIQDAERMLLKESIQQLVICAERTQSTL